MNEIFSNLLNISIVVYLNDILIYSDNFVDHKNHMKEILSRLWNNWLYVSLTKCIFHQDKIEFLGFVLGSDSLRMDESKIQIIQDWPTPYQVKDIQSFLEFVNFYQ